MSDETVELFNRALAAMNDRDLDVFTALMHDDVEALPRIAAIDGSYRGPDGIRRWWMSQQNVEIVRRYYDFLNARDVEGCLGLVAPSIEVAQPDLPDGGDYRGIAGWRRWNDALEDAWGEMRWEPHEFIDADDAVVVAVRFIGTGSHTSIEHSVERFHGLWQTRPGPRRRGAVGIADSDGDGQLEGPSDAALSIAISILEPWRTASATNACGGLLAVRSFSSTVVLFDVFGYSLLERLELLVEVVGRHLLLGFAFSDQPRRSVHRRAPGRLFRLGVARG
jgi:ketosteroid isomerase-like protein